MAEKKWREFEQLVAQIQQSLAPDASVEHDIRLRGERTGEPRQVDVLMTQNIGQYSIRIALDCKDYKTPVDVKGVEEFNGLLDDIGVNKGVLVCPSGFTATAKKRAKEYRIALYRPLDTGEHKWRSVVALPAMCSFVSAGIGLIISTIAPQRFRLTGDISTMKVFSPENISLPPALLSAMSRWNAGEYPTNEGKYDDLDIYSYPSVKVSDGYDHLIDVRLSASLSVTQQLYFWQVDIKRMSGFIDEHTGVVHTNAFTTGKISPEEIQSTWSKLVPGEQPPRTPVLQIQGLVSWKLTS